MNIGRLQRVVLIELPCALAAAGPVPLQRQRSFEILYDRVTDIAVATISHQESMDRPSLSQLPATQAEDRTGDQPAPGVFRSGLCR